MSAGMPFHFSPRPNRAHEIPWREWGQDAFDVALREDLPVLISISGAWCHWCHVMDETTYSDARVIDLISRRFVAIRVDADERPDVDARYNAGGWPTTAFATPEGDVITSATYLDPEQMLEALRRVQEAWLVNREAVAQEIEGARATRAAERAAAQARRSPGLLAPHVLDVALGVVAARYDADRGGFMEADPAADPERARLRFPQPEVLRLWRYAHHRRGTEHVMDRASFVARRMVEGGLYDPIDGAFFRYSTKPDWSDPHYEKLAADQGAILLAFADIAASDEDAHESLRPAVEATARYLGGTLSDALGGIRHSQDADAAYYALDEAGRLARGAPAVDRRVIAGSCAAAARGLLAVGIAYNRRDWVERGRRAVDFLLSHLRAGEAGMYHAWEGGPRGLGFLPDQVETLLAVLHAYEVAGGAHYLDQARLLARILERDWREAGRAFLDVAHDHDATALLAEPRASYVDNVRAAEAFLWLARLTHDDRDLEIAHEVLSTFATALEARGLALAGFARVTDRLISAEPEFKIVSAYSSGEPDRAADALHAEALRLPLPSRTVQRLGRLADERLIYDLGLPQGVSGVAYVCVGRVCSRPVTDPEHLMSAVEEASAAPSW